MYEELVSFIKEEGDYVAKRQYSRVYQNTLNVLTLYVQITRPGVKARLKSSFLLGLGWDRTLGFRGGLTMMLLGKSGD